MVTSYLLPCPCGATTPIDTSQAGQTIHCQACGKAVDVPTLRGIRQLDRAEQPREEAPPQRSWTRLQGVLFATGGGLAVTMLISSAILFFKKEKLDVERPSLAEVAQDEGLATPEEFAGFIDSRSPDQLWSFWHTEIESFEFPEWEAPEYVERREEARLMGGILKLTLILAACGISIAAGALLLKPQQRLGMQLTAAKPTKP